jgi:Na+-translocating ferredoxin:NAD+ oxidoreductase subunit D
MDKEANLMISNSPHILNSESTKSMMWVISLFLTPVLIFGIYAFGFYAAIIVITAILSSVGTEALILKLRKKTITIDDGSAFLTGLIIGLNMPPTIPLYIPIITSIFAILIVKQAFGGIGQNWANPAMVAIVFATFSWTKQMTVWAVPFLVDTITTATPLITVKSTLIDTIGKGNYFVSSSFGFTGPMDILQDSSYFKLFFGIKGGCIGEVSIFLLLISASYLIYRKIINFEIPLFFIGTVSLLFWIFDGLRYGQGFFHGDFIFQLLSGGLIFGAFFSATDVVTTPVTVQGRIIFGFGCGILTFLIRSFGYLSEGVALSIVFMNMFTPAIDKLIKFKPLGLRKIIKKEVVNE